MGYSEPALILGHSPSPNLMPPLSSPQDIIPDIILGPFLFPVQFLKPHQISCSVVYEFIQGKEKKSIQTNSSPEAKLLEGRELGKEPRAGNAVSLPASSEAGTVKSPQEDKEGFSHFSLRPRGLLPFLLSIHLFCLSLGLIPFFSLSEISV